MARALTLAPSEAWKRFHPELVAVTVDIWSEQDYDDEPDRRQLAADIEAGNITPDVLDEIEHCLSADWCVGAVRDAAHVVLAANGELEVFDPAAYYSRRMRTQVINGTRYIIG